MTTTTDRLTTRAISLPDTRRVAPPATAGRPAPGRPSLQVIGPMRDRYEEVLTPEALEFLTELHVHFSGQRHDLLVRRQERREAITAGRDPAFLPETAGIRSDPTWQVAGAGPGLEDRRVEITGPTDPKMAINALNSGAQVWLADLEDATSPTWANIVGGQLSLMDAFRGRLTHRSAEGKEYRVEPASGTTPTVVMRPRGWHLTEKHLCYSDRAGHRSAASASLVDFGLFFFHDARQLVESGHGPYFYLPKLEDHREARLWNEVFRFAQERIGMPRGTVRATVLIETITAAFEMEEILYELREHCAGLNAGRWDYIFSLIKNFRARGPEFVLPDRATVTMTVPPMRAYTELLVDTCHRRGAHAIGGMAAFIPQRSDPDATRRALEQVSADKRREATGGFDGTWVAHPGLIDTARAEFDAVLGSQPHQVRRPAPTTAPRDERAVAAQLLDVPSIGGEVSDAGLRANTSIAVRYLDAWLRGTGAAAIDSLMEDAATAEISRSQVWQWIHHRVTTREGTRITPEHAEQVLTEVLAGLPRSEGDRIDEAAQVFRQVALGEEFPTFLTIAAYSQHLVERPGNGA